MKPVLGLIFNKLVWVEDRLHFKLVCKLWREATQMLKIKPLILFKEPGRWRMTCCYGYIKEGEQWVCFEYCGFDLYYSRPILQYDSDGDIDIELIRYNREIPFMTRILCPVKGFFNNKNKIMDGESYTFVGMGGVIENDGKKNPRGVLYTNIKNIKGLNVLCMNAFREIKNRR